VDLCGVLSQQFNRQIILNNDAVAHTMAEYQYGTGGGVRRFMCLAIGTGVGGGVIVDGQPLRYVDGTPGDLGRVIVQPDGPPDAYKVRGSVESMCGVNGIQRLARERYGRDVPAHEVIAAAREGNDQTAVEIMQTVGAYLGDALAFLSPIFQPDRIALTGGTTEAGVVLLDACRMRFNTLMSSYHSTLAQLASDYYREVEIVLGKMRGETGIVGAVVELLHPTNWDDRA
jgi:glucokinase